MVPVIFTFYIQDVLKLKNNSGAKRLILNFNKTHYIQFMANLNLQSLHILVIKITLSILLVVQTFLGLTLDSTLSWKTPIDQPSSKLNTKCYAIRSLKSVISTKKLRIINFSYVHSIMPYGIIFWGNSPHSSNIFKLQKRALRLIMNVDNRVACCELFKKLNILPQHSQYILSLLLFVVNNMEEFISNTKFSLYQHST